MSECYAPDLTPTDMPDYDIALPEPAETGYGDTEGDPFTQTVQLDTNYDSEIDTVLVDIDHDFYDDIAAFDNTPGDGVFTPDVVAIGFDGDGLADIVIDDTNLDGIFDTLTPGGDEPLPYANPYETSAGVAPLR